MCFCLEVIGIRCEFGTARSVKPLNLMMDTQLEAEKKTEQSRLLQIFSDRMTVLLRHQEVNGCSWMTHLPFT